MAAYYDTIAEQYQQSHESPQSNTNIAPQLAAEATESEELFPTLPNFDLLLGSDNESDKGFQSPLSAAKKAKQKKRRKMAKASRKRNRQKRK